MLKIDSLKVNIKDKNVLKNISLEVDDGDVVAILGPNGHGKSTILKSIFNHYAIEKKSGRIIFNNIDITELSPDEISKLGLFLCVQTPDEIQGVNMIDFLRSISNAHSNDGVKISDLYNNIENSLKKLNLNRDILKRSVNTNFSGGEKKKSEIMQMLLINPQLLLLDEIDSGLDVDSLNDIINIINEWRSENKSKSIVIVSHNEKIFNRIKPNKVFVIQDGEIKLSGGKEIVDKVNLEGYGWINE